MENEMKKKKEEENKENVNYANVVHSFNFHFVARVFYVCILSISHISFVLLKLIKLYCFLYTLNTRTLVQSFCHPSFNRSFHFLEDFLSSFAEMLKSPEFLHLHTSCPQFNLTT